MQKKVNLFQDIEPEFINGYLKKCPEKKIKKGDILLSPQKQNRYVYILMSGKLAVYLDLQDDKPLSVIDKMGECIGEISIIDSLSPSAYIIATKDSTLLELNRTIVWEMIDKSHTIAKNLLSILCSYIRYGSEIISNNFEIQKKLQHYAMIDSLTGLYNRRWFDEVFSEQIKVCREEKTKTKLSIILLDIDHFKLFNDRFGHLIGDLVLKEISNSIPNNLRASDTLARFGGEEFIIMLPNTQLSKAVAIAEKIRISISQLLLKDEEKNPLTTVTVSLGISRLTAKDNELSLIKKADDALYKAKENGRNRVEIF